MNLKIARFLLGLGAAGAELMIMELDMPILTQTVLVCVCKGGFLSIVADGGVEIIYSLKRPNSREEPARQLYASCTLYQN